MARELVIDLGLLRPAPERDRDGGRWRRPRVRRRTIAVWLAAALVLSVAAGSAAPPVRVVFVPVPVGGRFEVVGDVLFVATGHGSHSAGWAAYDPSTGELLWTINGAGERLGLVAADGLLWDDGFPLDPATGRWLSPKGFSVPTGHRYLGVPGGDTLVISGNYRPYSDTAADAAFTYEVTGVDAWTGSVRWRDDPDPGVRVWLAGDPARLVTISSDDVVSIRDPDTGAVLASRQVPSATSAELIGDRLLVRVWEPRGAVRAFERDTMAPLWELPRPDSSLERCGPMLCRHTVPGRTELVDPATGQPAWATAYRLRPVGEHFLAHDERGALLSVLDARTGRAVRDLTGWQAVLPPTDRQGAGLEAVRLMRTDPAGDTDLARLDPATGRLTDLGRLPATPARCQPYSDGVVCSHGSRILVWPL